VTGRVFIPAHRAVRFVRNIPTVRCRFAATYKDPTGAAKRSGPNRGVYSLRGSIVRRREAATMSGRRSLPVSITIVISGSYATQRAVTDATTTGSRKAHCYRQLKMSQKVHPKGFRLRTTPQTCYADPTAPESSS